MKLLIFDTETTGLPKNSSIKAELKQDNWPHIVSIAWLVLDTQTNEVLFKKKYIIKPKWPIPQASIDIHGITSEYATTFGVELSRAISEFLSVEHDALVAHNINFDINVINHALKWDLLCALPVYKYKYCTMELSKDICKLPRWTGNGYKNPKLSELFFFTFQKQPTGRLHDCLYDTLILALIIKVCKPLRKKMGLRIMHQIEANENNSSPEFEPTETTVD